MSNELFAKHLGAAPSHFAYPSGSRNQRTDELLYDGKVYESLRLWSWVRCHVSAHPSARGEVSCLVYSGLWFLLHHSRIGQSSGN